MVTLTIGEEIFIKTFAGTTETLTFNPSETVGEVIAKLATSAACCVNEVAETVEPSNLRIRFAGVALEDDEKLLADYGVQRDSTLYLDRTVNVSVKDPYFDSEVDGESLSSSGDDVVAITAWSSSTVGDLLDIIASDTSRNAKRNRVKLNDDKPTPVRGFQRLMDESKTLADYGIDEKSTLVLERMLDIRVVKLRSVVQMWTYQDMEVLYRKLWEKCPERLIEYPTAAAFLHGCEQSKAEVLRSRSFFN